jgi:hypothetical protein
VWYANNLLLLT